MDFTSATFKYTISIEKAETRDGRMFITGVAAGPGIDLQGEEMDPQAITGFAAQIEDRVAKGDPIPYMDHHQKGGVLNELGTVVKGWVTDQFELGIEVELDSDNPAAVALFTKVNKGKKFGMSVQGSVNKYIDQFRPEIGKAVRRFLDVTLGEISNTTRPIWTPSFGTVLSKAIDDAVAESATDEGVKPVKDLPVEQAVPAADVDTTKAEDAAIETPAVEAEKAETPETPEAPVAPVVEDADVEKAQSAKSTRTLLAMRASIDAALAELGVIDAPATDEAPVVEPEKAVSDDTADPLTKAITDATAPLVTLVEDLQKSLTEATARIVQLENTPAGEGAPALIDKAESAKAEEILAKAQPRDLIRLGLAAHHGQR